MNRIYVWTSTSTSIKKKQISIFACIEIAWSIALYWGIWYFTDSHLHILFSLFAAPLLLLRSPESVSYANEVYKFSFADRSTSSTQWLLIVIVSIAINHTVFNTVSNQWLLLHEGFALVWRSIVIALCTLVGATSISLTIGMSKSPGRPLIGIVILQLVLSSLFMGIYGEFLATVSVITSNIIFLVLFFTSRGYFVSFGTLFAAIVFPLTIFFLTLGLRFYSTLRFLRNGIHHSIDNWRENMYFVDPFHPPSMLPYNEFLSIEFIKSRTFDDPVMRYMYMIFVPLVYAPAMLYRWSIKSTFWFYWPIMYVSNIRIEQIVDSATFNNTIIEHPMEKFRLVLAMTTVAIVLAIAFSGKQIVDINSTDPAMLFPYLLAIDIYSIKPWQWLQLATAAITIVLWSKAWSISIAAKTAESLDIEFSWRQVRFLQTMARIRNLTTFAYLVIGLVFTALYLDIYDDLPKSLVNWLESIFETSLPIRLGA